MSKLEIIEKKPCQTCPYRRDVPTGTWHPEEFVKLARNDRNDFGALYGCHKYGKSEGARSFCAGWLLDQRRRGYPAMQLRLRVITQPGMLEEVESISADGLDLYPSIAAMCAANGVRVP